MSRVLLVSALALAAVCPASAGAQAAPTRGPIAVVVDPGEARVRADRAREAIADDLGRELVRITDPRASRAVGTLTIAHEDGARWLVRYDAGGRSASTVVVITRPGFLLDSLGDASGRVIAEVEAALVPAPASPASPAARSDHAMYIAWADELIDPFASSPSPPRREVAIYSEVIDPFASTAARRVLWSEVLDPWGR